MLFFFSLQAVRFPELLVQRQHMVEVTPEVMAQPLLPLLPLPVAVAVAGRGVLVDFRFRLKSHFRLLASAEVRPLRAGSRGTV